MAIEFACPDCGKEFSVKDELAGVRGRCTRCGQAFRVPIPDQVEIESLGIDLSAPIRPRRPEPTEKAVTAGDGRRKHAAMASVACSSVIAACLVVALVYRLLTPEAPSSDATVRKSRPAAKAEGPPLSTEAIVARCDPCVGLVRCGRSVGTGFMVKPEIMVTNYHVVEEEGSDIFVSFPAASARDDAPMRAGLVYRDRLRDLALLGVPGVKRWITPHGDAIPRRGQDVVIIGNPGLGRPGALGMVLENVVTRGVMGSRVEVDGRPFDQVSATVNPGNSGGPVLDDRGRAIGVVTLNALYQQGIALCVPMNDVLELVWKYENGYLPPGETAPPAPADGLAMPQPSK